MYKHQNLFLSLDGNKAKQTIQRENHTTQKRATSNENKQNSPHKIDQTVETE